MRYQCYKCFYTTNVKCNFANHINRKKLCTPSEKSIYTDEEIKEYHDNQINNNKDIIDDNECKYCSAKFMYKYNLLKHSKIKHPDKIENSSNNIINSYNNITNNITVNIAPINLIPFNEDWNLSNINTDKKHLLLFSKIMYTKLLKEILENEINLNVIINKETNSGLVYSINNMKKEYINMDLETIVKKSMDKLNKHLNDISNDVTKYYTDIIQNADIVNDKYKTFNENKDISKIVQEYFSDIYFDKRDDAIKIMKDIQKNNDLENGY